MWQQLAQRTSWNSFFFPSLLTLCSTCSKAWWLLPAYFCPWETRSLECFPFNPKFQKFWLLRHRMDHFDLVWPEYSGPALKVVLFDWSGVPSHLRKLSSPVPLFRILGRTITKCAVAWVWSVQPKCTISLSMWNFRNFKLEFLLNGKHPFAYIEILCWAPCISQVQSSELPHILEARHWS